MRYFKLIGTVSHLEEGKVYSEAEINDIKALGGVDRLLSLTDKDEDNPKSLYLEEVPDPTIYPVPAAAENPAGGTDTVAGGAGTDGAAAEADHGGEKAAKSKLPKK